MYSNCFQHDTGQCGFVLFYSFHIALDLVEHRLSANDDGTTLHAVVQTYLQAAVATSKSRSLVKIHE